MKTKVSAIQCDTYKAKNLEKAILEAVESAGGLPDNFKPGCSVLLKPNLLTAKTPDSPTVTHPEFIRAVIRVLKSFEIENITVGDSPAGKHSWNTLWEKTGIKKVAEEENVKLIPFENIKCINIDNNNIPVLKEFFEYDGIISLPKLKSHLLTKMTGAVKNSYGLVIGQAKVIFIHCILHLKKCLLL